MTQPEVIRIDDVEYRRVGQVAGGYLRIVVVDNRGLTFVGRFDPKTKDEDGFVVIKDARCVIWWGTTKHLAELAEAGPLPNTKLGAQRDVTVQLINVVTWYECSNKWGGS